MATSKTLTPTNVTISIPEFTDQPDQRVNSNCIDKLGDAVNTLNSKKTTKLDSTNVTNDTSILSLENGAYQVSGSGDVSPYLPYRYGTLYVANSSNNYGMYLFESTVGTYYIRHRANPTTWSGDWKQIVIYDQSPIYTKNISVPNGSSVTFQMPAASAFMIQVVRQNSATSDHNGFYIGQAHSSGSILAIADSSVCNVGISGRVLTFTGSANYVVAYIYSTKDFE